MSQIRKSSLVILSSFRKNLVCKRFINHGFVLPICKSEPVLGFPTGKMWSPVVQRRTGSICFSTKGEFGNNGKESNGSDWRILKRWDVPWKWQRACLTMVACELSFQLAGLVDLAYGGCGLEISKLCLDDQAGIMFLKSSIATAAKLSVLYALLVHTFRPLPTDIFVYELKEPLKLQKGWLLWAGVGFVVKVATAVLTIAAIVCWFSPERETTIVVLLPSIGSSDISTAYLIGINGVLAPLVEETVFRGFLMVFLTKWFPTPVSVLLSAAIFAFARFTPEQFPQLFVAGTILGFSYAQTRNLLTPITIHAVWNSMWFLILTFLKHQGYDIK